MMFRWASILLLALFVTSCASSGGSRATNAMSGKERLRSLLVAKFEGSSEDFDERDRIPDADEPRALRCALDAMIADMTDAQANRLSDMFERKIAPEKDFVLYWVNPRDSGHADRAKQVEDRMNQICPDLAPLIKM